MLGLYCSYHCMLGLYCSYYSLLGLYCSYHCMLGLFLSYRCMLGLFLSYRCMLDLCRSYSISVYTRQYFYWWLSLPGFITLSVFRRWFRTCGWIFVWWGWWSGSGWWWRWRSKLYTWVCRWEINLPVYLLLEICFNSYFHISLFVDIGYGFFLLQNQLINNIKIWKIIICCFFVC